MAAIAHAERVLERARPIAARTMVMGSATLSYEEPVLQQHLDGADAVAPADLLALRAAARLEPHRQFDDALARAQQFGGDLRLDVEAVRFQAEPARHLGLHDLVAGLHVGDARA